MKTLLIRPSSHYTFKMSAGVREEKPKKFFLLSKSSLRAEVELGLLYMASFLNKKGCEVEILDLQVCEQPEKSLKEKVITYQPDIIGITAYTSFIHIASEIAHTCKSLIRTKIIVGGHHPSALPYQTLKEFPLFDYVIFGEGEVTLYETIEKIKNNQPLDNVKGLAFRLGNEIKVNEIREPISDLDSLPFPAREKIDIRKYIAMPCDYIRLPQTNVITTRGCLWECKYCSRTGSRLRTTLFARSPENIIAEIVSCIEKYKVYDYRFVDDIFTYDRNRVIEICNLIKKNKLDINWLCYSRADAVDKELLKIMKDSGCFHIKYGCEVGTQENLNRLDKRIDLQQCINAIKWTKEVGIETLSGFIIGIPGETLKDIKDTIRFAIKTSPDIAAIASCSFFPGSRFYKEAQEKGSLIHSDWTHYLDSFCQVTTDQLPSKLIGKMVRFAYRKFYFRPRYIFQRVVRIFKGNAFREIHFLFDGLKHLIFG